MSCLVGRSLTGSGDVDGPSPVLLGTMPTMAALAGLPCVDGPSAPGGPHTGTSMPSTSAPGGSLAIGPMSGTWALEDVPHPGGTGPSRVLTTGAYVGDGILPVPAKLVNKTRRWEFVEMGELLPEFWVGPKEAEGEPGKEKRLRQGRTVTEIFAWLQCFGTYVAVLSTHEPAVVPDMMAYMGIIIRVS